MSIPLTSGTIGELFWHTQDPVLLLRGRVIVAVNPAARRSLGIAEGSLGPADGVDLGARPAGGGLTAESVFGAAAEQALSLVRAGGTGRVDCRHAAAGAVYDATAWTLRAVDEPDADVSVLLLRDVTRDLALVDGLRRLSALARDQLTQQPTVGTVLQELVEEAKRLTGADFSALIVLRPGSRSEIGHFVYDAPRELFPVPLPRVVGLLAMPITSGEPLRLDDMRDHPAGLGIPVQHPPIGPLLAVPLLAGDEVIGEVVAANRPGRRAFDDADESLLVDLAAHATVALRYTEHVERHAAETRRRRDVTDAARHDIRSPLTAVKGYVTLLRRRSAELTPEQAARGWDGIESAVARIEAFVARLLVDERIEAHGVRPAYAPVEVAAVLAQLAADHEVDGASTGIALVTDVATDAPPTFPADPEMVREVLDNLVSNAVKFSVEGGTVTVSARQEGGHLRFDVHNHGEGIPVADQGRLFERYARLETATVRRVPGLGLGLSIVRRLMDGHGGHVGLSSRPGEGTTFWVTFPLEPPAAAQAGSA